jgi:hypothetical protein
MLSSDASYKEAWRVNNGNQQKCKGINQTVNSIQPILLITSKIVRFMEKLYWHKM